MVVITGMQYSFGGAMLRASLRHVMPVCVFDVNQFIDSPAVHNGKKSLLMRPQNVQYAYFCTDPSR